MLVVIGVIYLVLIFPLFLNVDFVYQKTENMLRYQIKAFGIIKIFFGYFELVDEGVVIHLNNSRAILIFYKDLFSIRKKFKPLKDYHIFKLYTDISIGIFDNEELKLLFITIYNFVFNMLGQYFSQTKPYLTLKSNISLYEKENLLSFNVKTTFVFNFLMIVISFVKIIMEKIIYAIKSKSQPN